MLDIEFLYFDGCPSYKRAEELLDEALRETNVEARVDKKTIESDEMAVAERFLGSPTIRINGVDVYPPARDSADYALKCRLYRTDQGFLGWPTKEMLIEAIGRAAGSTG